MLVPGLSEPIPDAFRYVIRSPQPIGMWAVGIIAIAGTALVYREKQIVSLYRLAQFTAAGMLGWTGCVLGAFYLMVRGMYKGYIEWSLKSDLKDIVGHYHLKEDIVIEEVGGVAISKTQYIPTSPSNFWVCTLNGEVVGTIALDHKPELDPLQGELRRCIVSPSHRNLGIAKFMIEVLLQHARNHNLELIVLGTTSMQHGAMRLYERFGWREVATDLFLFGIKRIEYHLPLLKRKEL